MSADMSPIEHVWGELGRRVRNRVPPPANVAQLSQMFIQEWNYIPQLRIQNVIQSMGVVVKHAYRRTVVIKDINNVATFA